MKFKPFLRWAGGKIWFVKSIDQFLPEEIQNYYEPFLGGGSVFFYLKQTKKIKGRATLSDFNQDLISCYIQVRDNIEGVIECLRTYKNEKNFYYKIREIIPRSDVEKAARFIYLNRTSFNGIYRVNLKGIYNVPYGFKAYSMLFDFENLRGASQLMADTEFLHQDYEKSVSNICKNDFIFLDPPYTVAHDNNGFIKYNQKIFAWQDQERLAEAIRMLNARGAHYILTNAAHPSIENLFGSLGTKVGLTRYSLIGGKKAKRDIKNEYVFFK